MEIDKLPPEVETAISRIGIYVDGKLLGDNLDTVRTHLHRLAEENARLLSIQIGMHRDVCANALRAEEAEARVQELERVKIALVAERDHAKLLQRKAEAERDALKARAAEAVVIECPAHKPTTEAGWAKVIEWAKGVKWTRGQRVALLKLEDGERE